jgi:hypothetical protein
MALYPLGELKELLAASSAVLADGLTDGEVELIENRFGFRFGPDHRELVTTCLPLGEGWPDWRDGTDSELQSRLDWPVDSVVFSIEHGDFWPPSWGARTSVAIEAALNGREKLQMVPVLVPVFSHRFLPAAPCEGRSPVFSVYGSDTIYYGCDLADYLRREFGGVKGAFDSPPAHVAFWSELAEGREDEI